MDEDEEVVQRLMGDAKRRQDKEERLQLGRPNGLSDIQVVFGHGKIAFAFWVKGIFEILIQKTNITKQAIVQRL